MATQPPAPFDAYATQYESALESGLRWSGEDGAYYARKRIGWLRERLARRDAVAANVLDFGCGTGSAAPLLISILGADRVLGADISARLLEQARTRYADARTDFRTTEDRLTDWADVAYCNGVFHHIDPSDRVSAVEWVWNALRPGGFFALWENNPWNPGARFVMSRIEFDRDAVMLTPKAARALLRSVGFEILSTNSLFYFPRPLRLLRPLERWLATVPLGAQYVVLARRAA